MKSILKTAWLNRRELKRFAKFSVVGAIGFVIDTGALNIMVGVLGMSTGSLRLLAKTISFFLALTSNFIWNRYWTYPESRSKRLRVQAAQFALVNAVGLALNLLIFGGVSSLLIPLLQGLYGERSGLMLGTNAGQVCAVAVVLFWNFFVNRHWTYSDVD
ncbi:MAG: GtrA family protein [Anaerolineales bacterium]|nr:GtrA family protein [Anaerolineales bacterium]HJO34334.1 GtrA family protein [Anaerolineales bacterium]